MKQLLSLTMISLCLFAPSNAMDSAEAIEETDDLCVAAAQGDLDKIRPLLANKDVFNSATKINEICHAIKAAMIQKKNVALDDQRRKEIIKTILTTAYVAELITTIEATYILIKTCRYGTASMLKMILNLSNHCVLGKITEFGAYRAFEELVLCKNLNHDKGDLLTVLLTDHGIFSHLQDGNKIYKIVSSHIETRGPQEGIMTAFFGSQHLHNLVGDRLIKKLARSAIIETIKYYKNGENLASLLNNQNITNLVDFKDWLKIHELFTGICGDAASDIPLEEVIDIETLIQRYTQEAKPIESYFF